MCTPLSSWPRRLAAQARQRVVQRAARALDEGFILLETLVAISLITVIMGAIGTEYVSGLASTSRQRAQQVASQLADSSVEQIRSLAPSDLITGHDTQSVSAEFSAVATNTRIAPWLAGMQQATDPTAAVGAGATATIPTVGVIQQPATVPYTVTVYLGWCYLSTTGASTTCQQTNSGGVQYLRAVVAVTWTNRTCGTNGSANNTCYFLTSTLVNTASDPLFQVTPPPNITAPVTAQTAAVGTALSVQASATGGTGTLTWSATALPTGVSIASSSGLITGTPTTVGTYNSTLTVTDGLGIIDTQSVTWTVAPAALNITYPTATQTVSTSAPVSVQATVTGGSGTKTWSVVSGSPLPTGLSISSTGLISGTPTNGTGGTYNSVIQVTDSSGTDTQAVTWTVLDISSPVTAQNVALNATVNLVAAATGTTGTLTWSATSLPTGLSISTGGLISGTARTAGTYHSTITVNDSVGTSDTQAVVWTVTATTPASITNPGAYVSRLTSNANYSLTATATGITGTLTWTATSLPTGLSISSGGTISGKTQTAGVWTSTITVRNAGGTTASQTVTWYIGQPVQLIYPTSSGLTSVHSSQTSIQMIAVGGSGSYQWVSNGGVPTGITLSSSGLFTGTMFQYAGTWNTSIYITDTGNGNSNTYFSFNWYIT